MGQAFTRAAQWTSAKDGTGGKLEFTKINEELLNCIVQFIDGYSSKFSSESKLVFKKPLKWQSSLTPNQFSAAGCSERGDDLVSDEMADKENPLFSLMKINASSYQCCVMSLEWAEKVSQSAGDRKLHEVRACLEANRDPGANILGDRFATVEGEDNSIYRFTEEITKEIEQLSKQSSEGEGNEDRTAEIEEKKAILKLKLQLSKLDQDLMNTSISLISKEVRLNPSTVDGEVKNLRELSGPSEESCVLKSIGFYGPVFVFENGCRAPAHRQLHGDIAYVEVQPFDTGVLYIMANTSGYYTFKGPDGLGEMQYEREGEPCRDLVLLLKQKSPKFAEMIDNQDFSLKVREENEKLSDHRHEDTMDNDEQVTQRTDIQRRKKEMEEQDKEKQTKQKTQRKKRLEPSLKWKALGMEEYKVDERQGDSNRRLKKKKTTPRMKSKTPIDAEDSFSESSTESEEEEEAVERRSETNADLPSEYWQIQKLVKYLKGGNQTATIIALCAMRDFNLAQETCQLAIRDVGGLEVLINLLDTEDIKCKIGSLKILKEISRNTQIRRAIADLGGLQTMVKILRDPDKDLKCLAAETIANVAKFRRARRTVRQHGGIKKLVGLLDCVLLTSQMTPEIEKDIEVARCGALALWSCSKSKKNKEAMRKAGAIPLLAKLLKSVHEDMLIPVVGTLQECASEPSYRLAIRTEGMIEDLVKNIKSQTDELQMHCASAVFKCAEEKETRDLVRQYGGLDPLVSLLQKTENKELLAAATGAIWKCAISPENVQRFQELKAIEMLVSLLNDQPEEVLVNVVGALGELAKDPPNRLAIRKSGGIPPLVNLLTGTNQALLVNVTKAVGQCAEEQDNMGIIEKLDGVRLLWSLLKNQNTEVQASAAWAICPCIEKAKDAGEMVRSFVGGLELIVSLLKSHDKEVLASVCAAIANIAKDEENLAVITDHGVVPMLAKLTNTYSMRGKKPEVTDDKLRRTLAEAIARCCNWGNNRTAFGREKAVGPLVKYLKSQDENVHRSTARALFQLSKNPENCITMHEAGVVQPLMAMVGSSDEDLQESAAGCISNIRRLALANEKARYS
ncbi:armadillo repeat-containing protein 4-like isoform X1 [Mizuhopecten yessoensis]|uniref:armadillo repeat-containing protein 4-like isoform X1 n=1 Tax=Mizuhopecten yessoensis TaxID=6573 RepID=UPI000B45918D|nr:armadillo repeat-containing protein 4-like isoform X1 [Mizuhopecten yessoensis]XP_021342536.1 armadillo repeat-containing protein 4-like isoform X1 [Mizuhopecten yessoensis]